MLSFCVLYAILLSSVLANSEPKLGGNAGDFFANQNKRMNDIGQNGLEQLQTRGVDQIQVEHMGQKIFLDEGKYSIYLYNKESQTVGVNNNGVTWNSKRICTEPLLKEKTFQKTKDGTLWYTNCKVGGAMSRTERQFFEKLLQERDEKKQEKANEKQNKKNAKEEKRQRKLLKSPKN